MHVAMYIICPSTYYSFENERILGKARENLLESFLVRDKYRKFTLIGKACGYASIRRSHIIHSLERQGARR